MRFAASDVVFKYNLLIGRTAGHKTCEACHAQRVQMKDLTCVVCRKEIEKKPLRIFLSSDEVEVVDEEPKQERRPVDDVLDGLKKIVPGTPVASLQRASGRIKKMQRRSGDNPHMAVSVKLCECTKVRF